MSESVLSAKNLVVGYGGRPVIFDINFELKNNEVLCLIGHNGAGKSTLLKSLFGLVKKEQGDVFLDNKLLHRISPNYLSSQGVSYVPEGRGIFPGLTVSDTMKLGLWAAKVPVDQQDERIEWVLSILPAMKSFYQQRAGTLSGGQQQIVSIGRSLLSKPRCLLMDEPSIGLAPKLFQDLLMPIRELQKETGMSILLVEQNVKEALKISDRVIVMKSGNIILETVPEELTDNNKLMELY